MLQMTSSDRITFGLAGLVLLVGLLLIVLTGLGGFGKILMVVGIVTLVTGFIVRQGSGATGTEKKHYECVVERRDDCAVVSIPDGQFNTRSNAMSDTLLPLARSTGLRRVIVDLSAVKALGSTEMGSLVNALTEGGKNNVEVVLACVSGQARSILKVTRLSNLFAQFDSVSDAMKGEVAPLEAAEDTTASSRTAEHDEKEHAGNHRASTENRAEGKGWFASAPHPIVKSMDLGDFEHVNDLPSSILRAPEKMYCQSYMVSGLGGMVTELNERIKDEHSLSAGERLEVFETHLAAACPHCGAGLTGDAMVSLSSYQSARAAIVADPNMRRLIDGKCPFCSSREYLCLWQGK